MGFQCHFCSCNINMPLEILLQPSTLGIFMSMALASLRFQSMPWNPCPCRRLSCSKLAFQTKAAQAAAVGQLRTSV